MRLLNVDTLEFGEFFESEVPPYCILSHRWGKGEVSYKDFRKGLNKDGPGYRKIVDYCNFIKGRRKSMLRECAAIGEEGESDGMASPLWPTSDWCKSMRKMRYRKLAQDVKEGGQTFKRYWAVACAGWVWIDTCCIDKRSSAELSEAINSMFSWYKSAVECHVYLADVPESDRFFYEGSETMQHIKRSTNPNPKLDTLKTRGHPHRAWRRSTWFTRGWTLQELLAPETTLFLHAQWGCLGHICKQELPEWDSEFCIHETSTHGENLGLEVSQITGIPLEYLTGNSALGEASVAQRMSWAAHRRTTRLEDQAYCLLGLFNINMPLIYGERSKAFQRLQKEIIKESNDHSILAWRTGWNGKSAGNLARSPSDFQHSGNIVCRITYMHDPKPYSVTNKGVEVQGKLWRMGETVTLRRDGEYTYLLELNCQLTPQHPGAARVRIPLVQSSAGAIAAYSFPASKFFFRDVTLSLEEASNVEVCEDLGEQLVYLRVW